MKGDNLKISFRCGFLQKRPLWVTFMAMKQETAAKRSVRLRFKNPKYNRIIRLNAESIARKMGFTEDQIFDITLAVEEAYTNAIEHSTRHLADIELEILFQLFPDRLEISIHDSGCGFDDRRKVENAMIMDINSDRGRGLGLIRTLSDKAEILSAPGAGTLIRITKFLTSPAVPATPSPAT
jgi:serine/threonine-protein kinase RsbW